MCLQLLHLCYLDVVSGDALQRHRYFWSIFHERVDIGIFGDTFETRRHFVSHLPRILDDKHKSNEARLLLLVMTSLVRLTRG
jgi:hypothetical protein